MKTNYNVRLIDHGDGKFSLGFVHRLKTAKKGGGEWVKGNRPKVVKLLTKGVLLEK